MEYCIRPRWKISTKTTRNDSQLGIQTEDLEETIHSMPQPTVTAIPDQFDLTANLPISFSAKVLRNLKPGQEIVRLSSDNKQVDLIRGYEIGVSCDSDSRNDEVPVQTINIHFRDINEDLTDRGIVWVHPGSPASLHLVIKAKALKTPGKITEIIKAAEDAVKTKVLARFTQKKTK